MLNKIVNITFDEYALFVGKVTIACCMVNTIYMATKGTIKLTKKVVNKVKEKKSK